MGGGGGKGGTQETTSKVELPEELNQAAGEVLGAGFRAAALPYSPNRGVTIAGFAPQQQAAMRGANSMAEAFGLPGSQSLGIAGGTQTAVNGIEGYSTGGLYDQMRGASMSPAELAEREQQRKNLGNASDRIYDKAGIDAGMGLLPAAPRSTEPLYDEDELHGMGGLERAIARSKMGQNPRGGTK